VKAASWERTTLGKALPIRYGKARTEKAGVVREETPVYGSSGVIDKFNRALTSGPTLIIGRKGTVGATHYSAEPCWPIDTVYFAEASEDKDLRFFKYLLDHLQLGRMDRSTAVPGLSRDDYNAKEIAIPDIDEQQNVVAEIEKQFTRLDAGVASLKRVLTALQRYRTSLLKAACEGRLVSTEAELARKENRSYETGEQLLQRILKERRQSWNGKVKYKQPALPNVADLPALPEGWAWASVDQLLLKVTDGDHQPPPQTDSGVPFLVIRNVRSSELDFSDTRFVSRQYADGVEPFRKPAKGDILYTLVGSYGMALRVTTNREFCIQRHIGVLRPHKLSPADYLSHILNSSFVFQRAKKVATGTAQLTVSLAGLRRIPIPLPPFTEQARIVAEVERRLSGIEKLEVIVNADLQRSSRLRQSVLTRAFSPT